VTPVKYIYQAVSAAGTAALASGATSGRVGDLLAGLLVVPASTSPGAIVVLDGSTANATTLFAGGDGSVSNLVTFPIPFGGVSKAGGWYVSAGSNVSVVAIGTF
jgi:hypothetical protein